MLDGGIENDAPDAGEQQQAQQQRDQKSGIEKDAEILDERVARFRIKGLVHHDQ